MYQFNKPRKEIINDYDLTSSVFHKWAVNRVNLALLKRKTILLLTKKELRELKKENAQLKIKNDILKQTALIFRAKVEVIKEKRINTISKYQQCVEP